MSDGPSYYLAYAATSDGRKLIGRHCIQWQVGFTRALAAYRRVHILSVTFVLDEDQQCKLTWSTAREKSRNRSRK